MMKYKVPKIVDSPEKYLVGMRTKLSLMNDTTKQLWQSFMPRRKEINQVTESHLYAVQVFDADVDMKNFTPRTIFEKWASVAVAKIENIPPEMESLILPAGKYAVFIHRGPASTFHQTLNYIYESWLPDSEYLLETRPHFELLEPGYKPDDPEAEETVWIPIKQK